MKKWYPPIALACLLTCTQVSLAQDEPALEVDESYAPLTVNLNESGSKYVRFIIWNQFWATATENNPGTITDPDDEQDDWTTDLALRRARILAYAQISPRFLILTHFGVNNQSFVAGGVDGTNKKPQLFFHDVWNEYMVIPDKLYVGTGLHYWHGVSRLTNASTLNFMTLDAPIFNWPTIELTDQFARQFGFYAKGKLGQFDYRIALNKPFAAGSLTSLNQNFAVNIPTDNWATAGYFMYQFRDQESNKLPYMVGSYLGTKSIFNIGAGFYHHPEASAIQEGLTIEQQDHSLFGVDVFYEEPTASGGGISIYSVYYNYDFGDNYLRNVGILAINGNNAQPTIGTGSIWYTQAGYAFPKNDIGGQFMPYATLTYKDFEALEESSFQYSAGLNYFISGHNAKVTIEYANRPYFVNGQKDSSLAQVILQTHIFL
ncbi:porin [Roseivirga sp. BDSF3-8]|uniref:porin n=1 Tax=Roseivirga sp. BDSF3-8 TaxID=3241598 RepID=UPI0035327F0B